MPNIKTVYDFLNEGTIINLPDAINPQDPVTLSQLLLVIGVLGETMTGAVNGINTVFTTAFNFSPGKTRLYHNGIRQDRGALNDYTETGANEITFNISPKKGKVTIDYIKS